MLSLILLLSCRPSFGDEQRYRVELIVLRHLDGSSQKNPVPELTDYSFALDLLSPAAPQPASSVASTLTTASATPGGAVNPAPASPEDKFPLANPEVPRVLLVETPSDLMQQAWQHLRSSSGFRPELYVSWEQAGNEPFPQVRIHDPEVLLETNPPAFMGGATAGGDTLEEATRYYRIDGSARLRRSRFLHLDLDIELRETLDAANPQALSGPAVNDGADANSGSTSFLVSGVQQSRQVQILQLEYFDGPVCGVLALVSRVGPVVTEAPADDLQAD